MDTFAGMPLIHEDAQMLDAFAAATAFSPDEAYYVGELLFRPAYCNGGLGQKLLARLESHIHSLCRYRTLTCATVERPDDHPLLPHAKSLKLQTGSFVVFDRGYTDYGCY